MQSWVRIGASGLLIAILSSPAFAATDYARAEQFLSANLNKLVFGVGVKPKWLPDQKRFWYQVKTPTGPQYVLIDPARNSRGFLFDSTRLAAAMIRAVPEATYEASNLGLLC